MSDYLGHLTTRSLAHGSGVRPQLLSTFEPMPADAEFKSPTDFESEVVIQSNSVESSRPATVAPSKPDSIGEPRTTTLPTSSAPDERGPISHHQTIRTGPAVHAAMVQRNSEPQTPAADNRDALIAFPPTPRRESVPPSTQHQLPAISETVTPAAAASPNTAVKPAEMHSEPVPSLTNRSIVPAVTVSNLVESEEPNIGVEAEEPNIGRFSETVIRAVSPAITPAVQAFSPSLPPAIPPQPPTIHVTIGRVEVRATPPPLESRPKTTKPPAMSLEAYLERRANGGQR
jgi:hypothetical protein